MKFYSLLSLVVLGLVRVLAAEALVQSGQEMRPVLSPIFGDHLVMQRGKPNRVWGWEVSGTQVRVEVAGRTATAVAGSDGRWEAELEGLPAGGPYQLVVQGSRRAVVEDVLVGEVWLCGGQSNMAFSLGQAVDGEKEVAKAEHPRIRFFKVPARSAYEPAELPQGRWSVCSPENFRKEGGFSAVAYYFACRLEAELGVPVGLIQDCLGGTPAESWTSGRTLAGLKDFMAALAEIERLKSRGGPVYGNYVMPWYDEYDQGIRGKGWYSVQHDESDWTPVTLPGGFGELGVPETPAVCWFMREIELPETLPAGAAKLFLGVVEKMDTAYVNGTWVGASSWVENPRVYTLPEKLLKPGKNQLTIRVLKTKAQGGFQSPAEGLRLELGDGKLVVPLAGSWKGRLSVDARAPHVLPYGYENYPTMPTVLYNGMLAPVAPMAIRGALWYQGEANTQKPVQYRSLLPKMIGDWRALFGQGDFPFYVVSLPRFMKRKEQPTTDGWAELREAQAQAVASVRNAGLAVAIDTGEADDIHPKEKRIIGERLALCALKGSYGKNVVSEGPVPVLVERVGAELRIHFKNTEGALVAKDGKVAEFSVCGADRVWHWAQARIEGETVVLRCVEVAEPVAARYAWQSNPEATLYNAAGLPAAPFRTDAFPLAGE